MPVRATSWLLAAAVGVCGLLVALRAVAGGPIHSFVTIARPLNLESVAAVSLLLAWMLLGRGRQACRPSQYNGARAIFALALVLGAVLVCYRRSLWFPLTSDDYVIVARALRGELLPRVLTEGDAGVAFRPLHRFLFAAQGWLGSTHPVWWHGLGLGLHLANCALVFALARTMTGPGAAVFAAALFGLHATHPEAVSWMNSRADVLAAFFLMSALLMFLSHCRRPHWGRQLAALVLVALAVLSKESAYVFAPLGWLLVMREGRPGWRGLRALVPFIALEVALFAYRWQVLGGLGGYASSETGRSMFLHLDLMGTVKVFCWRAWAILFFPVNWAVPTTVFMGLTLVLAAAGLLLLSRARFERRTLATLCAFVAISVLPVLPLALVGADLHGARVYYLPSIGFALLVAAALDAIRPAAVRAGVIAALLLFHFVALRHELRAWQSVTGLARRTCVDAAVEVNASPKTPLLVEGLPDSVDGVYFLGNGFRECVELEAGRRLPLLSVVRNQTPPSAARVLRWDPSRRRLAAAVP